MCRSTVRVLRVGGLLLCPRRTGRPRTRGVVRTCRRGCMFRCGRACRGVSVHPSSLCVLPCDEHVVFPVAFEDDKFPVVRDGADVDEEITNRFNPLDGVPVLTVVELVPCSHSHCRDCVECHFFHRFRMPRHPDIRTGRYVVRCRLGFAYAIVFPISFDVPALPRRAPPRQAQPGLPRHALPCLPCHAAPSRNLTDPALPCPACHACPAMPGLATPCLAAPSRAEPRPALPRLP